MKLSTVQTQSQVFAPFLQQSVAILFLPQADLDLAIETELENNPLLEGDLELTKLPADEEISNDLNKLNSLNNLHIPLTNWDDDNDESPQAIDKISLLDKLTQQLRLEISDQEHLRAGEFIIGNLDQNGYLQLSVEEISAILGITPSIVEEVRAVIQNFEPLGIASRNLKECLCVQLSNKAPTPSTSLATRIVQDYFEDLTHQKHLSISKKLKVSLNEIQEAVHLISCLNPKPASTYQGSDKNIYALPDVYIQKISDDEFKVEINKKGTPKLRINMTYQKFLDKKNISEQERIFIREKLIKAMDFIKSVQQRGETLLEISRFIVNRQIDFFKGKESGLIPMSLKDVALHINRCESTVSRAIHGKFMDTHLGLYPLKFFFTQAIGNDGNLNISTHTIKEELQGLIEDEDKGSPLSDQDIQDYFKKKGLRLARRTVSKYRQALRIKPSFLRKKNRIFD